MSNNNNNNNSLTSAEESLAISEMKPENLSERGKNLLKENTSLKAEMKELLGRVSQLQEEYDKSLSKRVKLDGICKELQKQMQEIKDESKVKIQEIEERGKNLATEVTTNMGIMDHIHEAIAKAADDSNEAKDENDDLTKKVGEMKLLYDEKQLIIEKELEEANRALIDAKKDYGAFLLNSAEEKEKAYGEMHKIANSLVDVKMELKNTKEVELSLRKEVDVYDEKFSRLQAALLSTNAAYEVFKLEMEKVGKHAKALEDETSEWQIKWDTNTNALTDMTKKHGEVQNDLVAVHEKLIKITNLYKALQVERTEMVKNVKMPHPKKPQARRRRK